MHSITNDTRQSPPSWSTDTPPERPTDFERDTRLEASLLPHLLVLCAKILRKSNREPVAPDRPLGEIGLDSVMFAELAAELATRYGLEIPLDELFTLSLAQVASRLAPLSSHRAPDALLSDVAPNEFSPASEVGLSAHCPEHQHFSSATDRLRRRKEGRPHEKSGTRPSSAPALSLFSFGQATAASSDAYALIIQAAILADCLGFQAIWLPERHFHPFGGISPSPAILAAALAMHTRRLRLRAGSVILPLHETARVVEDWSMVDALSHGRADLAFAWGWNPDDFVLANQRYADRRAITLREIDNFLAMWRNQCVRLPNGLDRPVEISCYPQRGPRELFPWLTCTADRQAFETAGARGLNVLTALLFQGPDELAGNISAYRAARQEAGHDPESGHVTLMVHTFVACNSKEAKQIARPVLRDYLASSSGLWSRKAEDLASLRPEQRQQTLSHALDRYLNECTLIGDPDEVRTRLCAFAAAGVNEIASLFDFGIGMTDVLTSIRLLAQFVDSKPTDNEECA